MRLDKGPWNREKLVKKGLTYGLWLLIAFWTGLTFTMYWVDAPTLVVDMLLGRAPYAAYFTTCFLALTTFVMAGRRANRFVPTCAPTRGSRAPCSTTIP